mmetsp:Transcript_97904/g.281286  ORF Transcript_97904/g.281286 Transcript_97904/m.281286 type:complete len:259 (-) Transcript_97904:42-818(-)
MPNDRAPPRQRGCGNRPLQFHDHVNGRGEGLGAPALEARPEVRAPGVQLVHREHAAAVVVHVSEELFGVAGVADLLETLLKLLLVNLAVAILVENGHPGQQGRAVALSQKLLEVCQGTTFPSSAFFLILPLTLTSIFCDSPSRHLAGANGNICCVVHHCNQELGIGLRAADVIAAGAGAGCVRKVFRRHPSLKSETPSVGGGRSSVAIRCWRQVSRRWKQVRKVVNLRNVLLPRDLSLAQVSALGVPAAVLDALLLPV